MYNTVVFHSIFFLYFIYFFLYSLFTVFYNGDCIFCNWDNLSDGLQRIFGCCIGFCCYDNRLCLVFCSVNSRQPIDVKKHFLYIKKGDCLHYCLTRYCVTVSYPVVSIYQVCVFVAAVISHNSLTNNREERRTFKTCRLSMTRVRTTPQKVGSTYYVLCLQ